jgi:hypothetical protein
MRENHAKCVKITRFPKTADAPIAFFSHFRGFFSVASRLLKGKAKPVDSVDRVA